MKKSEGTRAKEVLLQSLNDVELASLALILDERFGVKFPNAPKFRFDFDNNFNNCQTLFAHLKFLLNLSGEPIEAVMANISKLKKLLNGNQSANRTVLRRNSFVGPAFPGRFTILNGSIGEVRVTRHAWERFCKRFGPKLNVYTQEHCIDQLRRRFLKATEGGVGEVSKVLGLLNNNFAPVRYFYNSGPNIVFVVLEKDLVLKTVKECRRP